MDVYSSFLSANMQAISNAFSSVLDMSRISQELTNAWREPLEILQDLIREQEFAKQIWKDSFVDINRQISEVIASTYNSQLMQISDVITDTLQSMNPVEILDFSETLSSPSSPAFQEIFPNLDQPPSELKGNCYRHNRRKAIYDLIEKRKLGKRLKHKKLRPAPGAAKVMKLFTLAVLFEWFVIAVQTYITGEDETSILLRIFLFAVANTIINCAS